MHVQEARPVTPDTNVATLYLEVTSTREHIYGQMIYRNCTKEEINGHAGRLTD
jgi:hypothetical protein